MKRLFLILPLLLAGCANPGYDGYLSAQQSLAASRAQSDAARYNALATIAAKGDSAASVAAAMAIAMGGQSAAPQIEAPRNELLQWAGVLVPALTQAYAVGKGADVAINASNNAMQTSAATTGAFVGIAGKIQAPVVAAAVLPQANVITNTSTVLSGTGVLGSGSYSTDQHNISASYNPATTQTTAVGP